MLIEPHELFRNRAFGPKLPTKWIKNLHWFDYICIMRHHPVKLMIFKPPCHSDPLWRFDGDVPKASHLRKRQHSLRLAHLHRPTHVLHNSGDSRDWHAEPRGLVNRERRVGSWGAGRTSRPPPDQWGTIGPRTQRGAVVIMLVESSRINSLIRTMSWSVRGLG